MDTYEDIKKKIAAIPAALDRFNAIERDVNKGIAGINGPFIFRITRKLTDDERKEVIALSFLGMFNMLLEKDFIESEIKVDGEPTNA